MIIGKKDIRTLFEKSWVMSYVPAWLLFGERSKKKTIKNIYSLIDEAGVCHDYIWHVQS